jgi:hypothetical protein
MSNPTYTFTPNIPQFAQEIKVTQPGILSNFQAINELLSVNHVSFSNPTDFGKHNFTSLQYTTDPTTTSTEMALYAKSSTDTNGGELYYRYPNSGTVVQLTPVSGGSSGGVTNGWVSLSSTVTMKWGTATGIITGSNTITFPTGGGIPAYTTTPFVIFVSPAANYTFTTTAYTYIASSNNLSFVLSISGTYATSVYWLAIGQ